MGHQPGAIVIGGHFQGLGVIRALAGQGIRILLLDKEPCIARFSRYVERYVRCPDVLQETAFVSCLKSLGRDERYRGWVVYATDDETVFVLSNHKAELEPSLRITTPEWDSVRYAYDKRVSYRLAEALSIPIPRSSYPERESDLDHIDIPFPLIIKPAVMRSFFRETGKKVYRVTDRAGLHRMYCKAAGIVGSAGLIVQEEIPEVSKHLFSFCPMFRDGKVQAGIVARRPRQHPMDFGQASTYAMTVEQPELEVMGTTILKAMNYRGICEVEFIQDPRDKQFKFLEINPRIWGWHTLAGRAGVNLPYYAYLDQIGRPCSNGHFETGVKWMRLMTDIPTAVSEMLKGRMSLKSYMGSWQGKRELAVLSRNDPMPFFGEFLLLPYLWKKRGF